MRKLPLIASGATAGLADVGGRVAAKLPVTRLSDTLEIVTVPVLAEDAPPQNRGDGVSSDTVNVRAVPLPSAYVPTVRASAISMSRR